MNIHFGSINHYRSDNEKGDRFMFSMQNVGKKINQLRKAANMTQMELADRLRISFQAVSNWERGESMPDISKLPELAEILNTTVDDLLGGTKEAKIIDSIIENKPQEHVTPEEFVGVVPLLKPIQVERLFEEVKDGLDFGQIANAAPFLSEEFIDKIARKKVAETGRLADISPIAPFVSEKLIGEMAMEAFDRNGNLREIAAIAPFIDDSLLDDMAKKAYDRTGKASDLAAIAPFISDEIIDGFAEEASENGDLSEIAGIAPFISDSKLNEIALKALKTGGLKALTPILPFIDSKMIEEEIERKLK